MVKSSGWPHQNVSIFYSISSWTWCTTPATNSSPIDLQQSALNTKQNHVADMLHYVLEGEMNLQVF